MQNLFDSAGLAGGDVAANPDSFDAKRDLGRILLRRLRRSRARLMVARKLPLARQQNLADVLWQSFLQGVDPEFLQQAPSAITTSDVHRPCATWKQLKYWTFIASCFEQHRAYEELLASYDASLPAAALQHGQQAWFFGSGHGRSTLNTYRALEPSDGRGVEGRRFEKVYSNAYDDFSRTSALEAVAGPDLRARGIGLAPVLDVVAGRDVTVVRSAFVTGRRLDTRRALARGADVVEALMQVPVADASIDPFMRRYHANVIEAFANARRWLERRTPERCEAFDSLAATITNQYPRVLAHGDLHRKNMFNRGGVLDWDNCGFYQVGFDPGVILSKSIQGGSLASVETVLDRYFLKNCAVTHRPCLFQGALFFGFVFGSGKKSAIPEPLLMKMLDRALGLAQGETP